MPMSPERRKEYQLERYRERLKAFIEELGGECNHCGFKENLEFDHIDPSTKLFTITQKLVSAPLADLKEELEKCQLLCTDCHKEKTSKEAKLREPWNKGLRLGQQHGSYSVAYNPPCPCPLCVDYREKRNSKRRTTDIQRPQTFELIHGTRAGYLKEKRRGITPCDACKLANAEYTKRIRAKHNNLGQ